MPAKKYATVEDIGSLTEQIGALAGVVERLITVQSPSVPVTPNGNTQHITLTQNGEPYSLIGLHPNTLTYRTGAAVNGLEVGGQVSVPVNSNGFRKRLNRFLSGELSNGVRTFTYKWDEKAEQGIWTQMPQYGNHVFTLSRKRDNKRKIGRAQ